MYTNPITEQQKYRTRLSDHMIKSGIGLLELAALMGISHTTITNFISKGKNVRLKQLGKIIKYLESLKEE
jgi:DNA-binding Xre family transcriptional regulator